MKTTRAFRLWYLCKHYTKMQWWKVTITLYDSVENTSAEVKTVDAI